MFSRFSHLENSGILFKQELSIPDYISNAEDRLGWHANELPVDNLCVENAIMIQQHIRYPLIIGMPNLSLIRRSFWSSDAVFDERI
jgi:hypothetical protein